MMGTEMVSVKSASNFARSPFRQTPPCPRLPPCTERTMLSRFYESDCRCLSIFSATGGYRHPVNHFAPSPRRMAHLRSRFPTDNNMAFNESVGRTPQRAISGSYRDCGFAGNYIVHARR